MIKHDLLSVLDCNRVILSTNKRVKKKHLRAHGLDKTVLVPDSCRENGRKQ